MSHPPHHPLPLERAHEPQFSAPAWAEGAPPMAGQPPGPRAGLDGAPPPRGPSRPLLPWALLAAAVAAAAWLGATVVLPLRAEAMQCQAQLLAAQAAFVVPEEATPAAEEVPDAADVAEAPVPVAHGQAAQLQVDALVEQLAQGLGDAVALGQVAVHPDEGTVRVVVSQDVAAGKALAGLFGAIAQALHALPDAWEMVVEVGRPRWSDQGPPPPRHRRGRRGAQAAAQGVPTPAELRLLAALSAADGAAEAAQVRWLVRLVASPEGALVVRLKPASAHSSGVSPQAQ